MDNIKNEIKNCKTRTKYHVLSKNTAYTSAPYINGDRPEFLVFTLTIFQHSSLFTI